MSTPGLPLRRGDLGPAVRDLHRRLAVSGVGDIGDPGVYDDATEAAVHEFQRRRQLVVDGICGPQTWAALVEADYRLGDRMIYLRSPMTRGDDVTELQRRLGSLGFDAGWVDGIFGPDTESAVRDFQQNQGLATDGVVGRETVDALLRVSGRVNDDRTVAAVKEVEGLRGAPGVEGRRLVIGESGGVPTVVDNLARRLRLDGAEVLSLHHPDLSSQARAANEWDGAVFVGVTLADDDFSVAYFKTDGFESTGGRLLAGRCANSLQRVIFSPLSVVGLRLPILRETRMPAVWCRIGPAATVVERAAAVTDALRTAVTDWCVDPLEGQSSTP